MTLPAPAVLPEPNLRCPAGVIARDCIDSARYLATKQNDNLTIVPGDVRIPPYTPMLSSGQVGNLVATLISAGNLLAGMTKINPTGDPPPGWTKKCEFTMDGRAVITFVQEKLDGSPAEVV